MTDEHALEQAGRREHWSLPRLSLVLGAHAAAVPMLELAARLAARGPLRVLDGGNRFNVYPEARSLRRLTADSAAALARIQLARAFTCYQMLTLLGESPAVVCPTLALDFLATFYDENVPLRESARLLNLALVELRRLSQDAPVVISARRPPEAGASRLPLLEMLQERVPQVFDLDPQPEAPNESQLPLW